MKTLRFVLLVLPLLLLAVTRQSAASPATVVMFPEDGGCSFPWGGVDGNGPHVVLLDGRGVLTLSNNSRDNRALHCGGDIAFGQPALVYVPDYGDYAVVQLLTIDQVCSIAPYQAGCHGADSQAAVIFTADNVPGFSCNIGGSLNTSKVTERVTPGGQAQITCHLPE
jgi:hypothetical protein